MTLRATRQLRTSGATRHLTSGATRHLTSGATRRLPGSTTARRVVACAAAVTLLASLAACSSGDGDSGSSGGGSGKASAWILTGGTQEQMWKDSFDAWNTANADRKITVEGYANDAYKEKIRTAVGAGTAPTLIIGWGNGGTLQDYVKNSKVADLTGKTDTLLGKVIPSVADGGKIDGKVYAVPNTASQPVVLYYNKELFTQAGVEIPSTWEDFLALIPKFKAAGVAPIAIAGQSKWPDLMWLEYLADRVGGPELFNNVVAGKADAWSDPDMITALTMIQDLIKAGGFIDGYGSVTTDSSADAALLYTGKAAMLLQGSWIYSTIKADSPDFITSGKLGAFPFPAVTGGKGDISNIAGNTSNYWSVSADASEADQQTAIDYLNTEVFTDAYTQSLIDGGNIPPIAGMEDKLAKSDDADFLTMAYGMVRDAKHFQLSWDQALSAAAGQELLTNLDQLFNLQITPEQFATAMNATIGK